MYHCWLSMELFEASHSATQGFEFYICYNMDRYEGKLVTTRLFFWSGGQVDRTVWKNIYISFISQILVCSIEIIKGFVTSLWKANMATGHSCSINRCRICTKWWCANNKSKLDAWIGPYWQNWQKLIFNFLFLLNLQLIFAEKWIVIMSNTVYSLHENWHLHERFDIEDVNFVGMNHLNDNNFDYCIKKTFFFGTIEKLYWNF